MKIIYKKGGEIILDTYLAYLSANREKLPKNVRDFAFLPYHYHMTDRRCPHDSWVNSVNIIEDGSNARMRKRNISITARFIGSYQDGLFDLIYSGVGQYEFSCKSHKKNNDLGHGDWIVDEIILTSSNKVSHEIEFSNGGVWKIICEDIIYSWNYIS